VARYCMLCMSTHEIGTGPTRTHNTYSLTFSAFCCMLIIIAYVVPLIYQSANQSIHQYVASHDTKCNHCTKYVTLAWIRR